MAVINQLGGENMMQNQQGQQGQMHQNMHTGNVPRR